MSETLAGRGLQHVSKTLAGRGLLGKNPPFAAGVRNPGRKGLAIGKNHPYAACIRHSGRKDFLGKTLPPFGVGVRNPDRREFARENPSMCSRCQKPGQERVC
jgi:hypothetical protein